MIATNFRVQKYANSILLAVIHTCLTIKKS